MRKLALILILAAAAMAASCGGDEGSAESGGSSIVYSGFGGSHDETAAKLFFEPFTESAGVRVTIDPSSEDIVAKLRAAANADNVVWSVIRAEEEDAVVLIDDGLIRPLPDELRQTLRAALGEQAVTEHGVAYIDYSSVLVCNRKLAGRCPRNMQEFWDVERFPGPRTLFADGWLDNVMFALEADGVPHDELFPLDVDRAFRKLDEIRDHIDVWWTNSEQVDQAFRSGEVAVGVMWSGRAARLASDEPDVELHFDGAISARELLVVPEGAPDAEAGFGLIEWYATHPEAATAFMLERRNPLPHPEAFESLPDDIVATMSSAPQNLGKSVPVDFGWVRANRDEVFKRWQEWLTG